LDLGTAVLFVLMLDYRPAAGSDDVCAECIGVRYIVNRPR